MDLHRGIKMIIKYWDRESKQQVRNSVSAIDEVFKDTREANHYNKNGVRRYNLLVGRYIFMQDNQDRNKFHVPGGSHVTESEVHNFSKNNSLGVVKRDYINSFFRRSIFP
tara:strand:- start:2374 stop:2703 length:330 start_codon:yes stop_codon:yes gene_type:complete